METNQIRAGMIYRLVNQPLAKNEGEPVEILGVMKDGVKCFFMSPSRQGQITVPADQLVLWTPKVAQ